MDKSFQGLLFSILLHGFLIWVFLHAKFPHSEIAPGPVEVVLIDKPKARKTQAFVTETEQSAAALDNLKTTADYLSQFTKRVKRQMRASRSGPTVNRIPVPQMPMNPSSRRVGGNELRELSDQPGETMQRPGGSQAMRNVAIGVSSLAEYIPGVEEGAFTSLNTDQFTYYAFFARMNEQVRNRWVSMIRDFVSRLSAQELESLARIERQTIVEILLGPEGQYETAVMHTSSGNTHLDQIPVDAFSVAAPFPNPPRGMIEEDGLIHLKYAFVVQFRSPSLGPDIN